MLNLFATTQTGTILGSSGRVRQGLSSTTAGSYRKIWPIRKLEKSRSEYPPPGGLLREAGKSVATHPVAQLKQEDIPLAYRCKVRTAHSHYAPTPFHTMYDNDGREVYFNRNLNERVTATFDAAGRHIEVLEENYNQTYSVWESRWNIAQGYDGDGQRFLQQENGASFPTLLLRSTAMGGTILAEVNKINGTWYKDVLAYAGGEIVSQQKDTPTTDEVKWLYTNPITGAQRGAVESEPDPLGTDQGLSQQQPNPPISSGDSGIMDPGRYADAFNGRWCSESGTIIPCYHRNSLLALGAADRAPAEMYYPIYSRSQGRNVGFAVWSPAAAAAGVGVSSRGLHGLSNNSGSNTGWVWMGQTFSTQGGVGGVSANGTWYSLGDFGYAAGSALGVDVRFGYDAAFLDRLAGQTVWWKPLAGAEDLKTKIIDRLNQDKGKCRAFVDAVRKELGIEKTIEQLYDQVIKDGGQAVLALKRIKRNGQYEWVSAISAAGVSRYGKNNKDIGIAPVTDSSERYTNTAIHELIHRGGPESHESFARSAFKSLNEEDKKSFPLPTRKRPGTRDMDDTYSGYFSELMNYFCRPTL